MEVIIDDRINVLERVKAVLKGGHILAVYRECDRIYAENVLKELVREYRITKKIMPSDVANGEDVALEIMDSDEDVRLVLAFGYYPLIEASKEASTLLGVPLIVMLTTPCRIAEDSSMIFKENKVTRHKSVAPKLVIGDRGYLIMKGGFASIIGDIAERVLMCYDRIYQNLGNGNDIEAQEELLKTLDVLSSFDATRKVDMLDKAYKMEHKTTGMASYIANMLASNSECKIDVSSYKFIVTYTILLLYRAYLKYEGDDLLYPPDIVASAMDINKNYGIDVTSTILDYRMMTSSEYMRITHIASEYREELIDILNRCIDTFGKVSKTFRRVSKDAGYNAYNGITLDRILEQISLLSIYESRNTPLRIMKNGGYLERYMEKISS